MLPKRAQDTENALQAPCASAMRYGNSTKAKFTPGGSSMFMPAKQPGHAQDCTRLWDLKVCTQTYYMGSAQQLSHLSSGLPA